jgi:hypothetical protein
MATYAAIAATTHAIRALLANAARASTEFAGVDVDAILPFELQKPIDQASKTRASVYLYRVAPSSVRRHIGPRSDQFGIVYRPSIPVDLHYLVTAWAAHAETQHQLLGWCVRMLEDTPIIPTGLLNAHQPGTEIFRPDETVELVWQSLTVQDLSEVWEVAPTNQQPSVAYVARMVQLDSTVPLDEGALVTTRIFDLAERT